MEDQRKTDKLLEIDISHTLFLLIKHFTTKLWLKVNFELKKKHQINLNDNKIMTIYPEIFKEKKMVKRANLKILSSIVNTDPKLLGKDKDPYVIHQCHKINIVLSFYYAIKKNQFTLMDGIECLSIIMGLITSLNLDPADHILSDIKEEYKRFCQLEAMESKKFVKPKKGKKTKGFLPKIRDDIYTDPKELRPYKSKVPPKFIKDNKAEE